MDAGSNTHLLILAIIGLINVLGTLLNTRLTRHAKNNADDAAGKAGIAADKASQAAAQTNGILDTRIRAAVRSELAVVMKEARPQFRRMIREVLATELTTPDKT